MNDVWKMIRHSTRTAKFGLVVVAVWIVVAVLAPILAPYGMNDIDVAQRLAPPCWMEGGSMDHIFGTDQLGRDVLTRLIYGSRILSHRRYRSWYCRPGHRCDSGVTGRIFWRMDRCGHFQND